MWAFAPASSVYHRNIVLKRGDLPQTRFLRALKEPVTVLQPDCNASDTDAVVSAERRTPERRHLVEMPLAK
jgi:hypothetical protein